MFLQNRSNIKFKGVIIIYISNVDLSYEIKIYIHQIYVLYSLPFLITHPNQNNTKTTPQTTHIHVYYTQTSNTNFDIKRQIKYNNSLVILYLSRLGCPRYQKFKGVVTTTQ